MCGITGVFTRSGAFLDIDRVKGMVDVIAHRGPDDAGYLIWQTGQHHPRGVSSGHEFTDRRFQQVCPLLASIDSQPGRELLEDSRWDLFLGHRRLSILDLSSRGHQPMHEKSRDIWVVHSGEIYNFRELRDELKARGHSFSSRTDTEVIIHAYEEWGIDCVNRFNGMFAFALWDNKAGKLFLVRDRYGIKPLYYHLDDAKLVFGSEIKSIMAYLPETPDIDLLALNEYFSFQNVFSDRTLFAGVRLLPPGTVLTLDARNDAVTSWRYWDFDFTRESQATEQDMVEELYNLIEKAVTRQCVSDVPIGSYLSGGMDSGTITAIASRHLGRIQTFTSGFDLSEAAEHEMKFDERELAEKMASVFQSEHYECVLHAGDIEAVMDRLIWHLEDLRIGQCYPNYYVARLASKFVKVCMSGGGGDELFGGYPWRYAAAIGASPSDYVKNYYRYWKRLVSNHDKLEFFSPQTIDRLKMLDDGGSVPFKDHTLSTFQRVYGRKEEAGSVPEQVNSSLYFECKTFLHGLLVVEDKLSMAHGLETRVPFLDNDLVDFACRVPISYKVSGMDNIEKIDENMPKKKRYYQNRIASGKNILRKAMERILPSKITRARKQGFSAPDESWFRGTSESYVRRELLSPTTALKEYINQDFVRQVLDEHSSGQVNRRLLIWSLLSFETWLRRFM